MLRRPLPRSAMEPVCWSGLPCWWSAARWLVHVTAVYQRAYLLTRHELVAATGGGVSLRAVTAVATAHAQAADFTTGRNSRPLLGTTGGPTGLTHTTGLGQRTISRARTWLRLVGLATEVAGGRHRTLLERLASWERGDTHRGWTAEYALHPSPRYPDPTPVDNSGRVIAGQTPDGTPPRRGSSSPERSAGKVVTTQNNRATAPATRGTGGAPRRAPTSPPPPPGPDGPPQPSETTPTESSHSPDTRHPGTALMLAWRTLPTCPSWARRYGAHRWAGALTTVAAAGWTARDLDQLLTDRAGTGRPILRDPRRPISYLCHLLHQVDLNERPTAILDAHAAADIAHRAARTTAHLDTRDTTAAARATAIAALTGPGRAAALAASQAVAAAAAHRRSLRESAERLAVAEQVARRRNFR